MNGLQGCLQRVMRALPNAGLLAATFLLEDWYHCSIQHSCPLTTISVSRYQPVATVPKMAASLADDRVVFGLQEVVRDLPKSLFTHAQSSMQAEGWWRFRGL